MASHDAELALGVAASLEDSSTLSEGQDNGEDRMAELFPDDAPPPDGLDGLLTGVRQGKLRRKARIKAQASVNKVKRHRTICCVVSGLVIACVLVGLIIVREGKNPLHLDQDCISLSHNLPPDFEPSGLTYAHGSWWRVFFCCCLIFSQHGQGGYVWLSRTAHQTASSTRPLITQSRAQVASRPSAPDHRV